jgi:nucleoside-diphosphate-sugar epimerase
MRISIEDLTSRRIDKKSHFLVTGPTGFLGSHLFIALCEKGYHVALLCRPTRNMPAHERVNAILEWFGKTLSSYPTLSIVEGYIDRPRFGLSEAAYHQLAADTDELIHCASSTDFSTRNRATIEAVNIKAFGTLLDFASASRCVFFHYISTAYAAGKAAGVCLEELSHNRTFSNVYEETKNLAEHMASQTCETHGIRLSIYRPSVVYGDSITGRSRKFNALYFPVKIILFLSDIMVNDIEEHGGHRATLMDIKVLADGRVHMPIRMMTRIGGKINLIPVNYFTAATVAIIEEDMHGGIHHIVNDSPIALEDLIGYVCRLAGIDGLKAVNEHEHACCPKNALEELFESYITMYSPYMADLRIFCVENTAPILKKRKIECPPLTYEVFERCMRYAMAMKWGKNL